MSSAKPRASIRRIGSHVRMKKFHRRSSVPHIVPQAVRVLLLAVLTGCTTSEKTGGGDSSPLRSAALTVVSLNLRYDNSGDGVNAWPNREAAVIEALDSFHADVIGLQEALPHQAEVVRSGLPGHAMLIRTRELDPSTGEATPILWRTDRWKLDPRAHGTFWLSETPEVSGSRSWDSSLPRIATFARLIPIGSNDGRSAVWIYNTHFDHRGGEARLESARLLRARIEAHVDPTEPVVLMGDFNAVPTSTPIREIVSVDDSTRIPLVDCWAIKNADEPKNATWNGFDPIEVGRRIDFIFASDLEIENATIERPLVDGRPISDHWPVRVIFNEQPEGSTVR